MATVCALAFAAAGLAQPAVAQEADRRIIGWGGMVTNDFLGDGADRWRSGAYMLNLLTARGWSGTLPAQPGEVVEFRLGAEIIAPRNLANPDPDDRLYAGVLSLGAHTHFQRAGAVISVGADLVAVGPQTQIDEIQGLFHAELMTAAAPPPDAEQIDNAIYPTALVAGVLPLAFGPVTLRPFAEAQLGYETFARVGGDVVIGTYGRGGVMVRARPSGFENPALTDATQSSGLSLVLGGDITAIQDSRLLPANRGPAAKPVRTRLRAGLAYDAGPAWVFLGVAQLSREFEGQTAEQRVGAVTANIRF